MPYAVYCKSPAGPTWTDNLLLGSEKIGSADINLFRTFFGPKNWEDAVPARDAIAGIESTIQKLGIEGYRAPPSPQLRLADFIRGVLGVPGGYDRVLLRNADGSMTLFRAAGTRRINALQRRVDCCHCIGSDIGLWHRITFYEKLFTSSKDLDKLERRALRPNADYFRRMVDLPESAPAIPVSPSSEEYSRAGKVLSITLSDDDAVDEEVIEAEDARRRSDSLMSMSDPRYQELLARLLDTGPVPENSMPSHARARSETSASMQNAHQAGQPVASTSS